MKSQLVTIAIFLFTLPALSNVEINCTATKVYGAELGENFKVNSKVLISSDKVMFGDSNYSAATGYRISFVADAPNKTRKVIRVTNVDRWHLFRISIDKKTKLGKITFNEVDLEYGVADVNCN